MSNIELDRLLAEFRYSSPAAAGDIETAEAEIGTPFPEDYRLFLSLSNGGQGPVGKAGYLKMYSTEELLRVSHDYGFAQFAPNLVPIGGNLGGTAYCFGRGKLKGYYECEFVDLEEHTRFLGDTLVEMVRNIGIG